MGVSAAAADDVVVVVADNATPAAASGISSARGGGNDDSCDFSSFLALATAEDGASLGCTGLVAEAELLCFNVSHLALISGIWMHGRDQ